MVWQKMRQGREFSCPECKKMRTYDEYDEEEDMCLFCLFPEAQQYKSAEYDKSRGYNRNQTEIGYVVDNLKDIPTKKRDYAIDKKDRKILKQIKKKKAKISKKKPKVKKISKKKGVKSKAL